MSLHDICANMQANPQGSVMRSDSVDELDWGVTITNTRRALNGGEQGTTHRWQAEAFAMLRLPAQLVVLKKGLRTECNERFEDLFSRL
jgi:hypothetical protein